MNKRYKRTREDEIAEIMRNRSMGLLDHAITHEMLEEGEKVKEGEEIKTGIRLTTIPDCEIVIRKDAFDSEIGFLIDCEVEHQFDSIKAKRLGQYIAKEDLPKMIKELKKFEE